ncbi:hypothetical protein [Singulisphaera sp. PoT]|uniref:hypothetical protein n=1 Tax=Singulisphaera sp. PoT TaxID=3411797 RepID=UPI003BF4D8D9
MTTSTEMTRFPGQFDSRARARAGSSTLENPAPVGGFVGVTSTEHKIKGSSIVAAD